MQGGRERVQDDRESARSRSSAINRPVVQTGTACPLRSTTVSQHVKKTSRNLPCLQRVQKRAVDDPSRAMCIPCDVHARAISPPPVTFAPFLPMSGPQCRLGWRRVGKENEGGLA